MYKFRAHTGFTLVEIMVVVVIVAILSTVWFMSYSSYFVNSRDATRISDITKAVEVIQSYALENKLPLPDQGVDITLSWSIVWYQWKLWEDVKGTLDLPDNLVDPKDNIPYTYFLWRDRKWFQFLVFMEQRTDLQSFISSSYALDYIGRYPRTFGDALWVFTDTQTNIPLEDISTIGDELQLENIGTGQLISSHLSGNEYVTGNDDRFRVLPNIVNSRWRWWVVEENRFKCYDPNSDGRCSTAQEFITYNSPTNASMGLVPRWWAPTISSSSSSSTSSTSWWGTPPVIGFESVWKTDNQWVSADNQIRLPLIAWGNYNFTVDWESDGIIDDTITSHNQLEALHTYDAPGIYTVNIVGTLEGLNFYYAWDGSFTSDRNKIVDISNWWGIALWNEEGNFRWAENLNITATDSPDLSNQTTLAWMFALSPSINADLSMWDISNVTDLTGTFYGAHSFNGDISTWDTSSVTSLEWFLGGNNGSNIDINTQEVTLSGATYIAWDTSSVQNMSSVFYEAQAFNSPIWNWDTSSVTNTSYMFQNADGFNQELNTKEVTIWWSNYIAWDVKNVSNVSQMFRWTAAFNGDISNWNLSWISSPYYLFRDAEAFNKDVSTKLVNLWWYTYTAWDVSQWNTAQGIFQWARAFNQPLNSWDVSNLTDLTGIISMTYNQPVDSWDTSKNTSLRYVFSRWVFNQDISMWDTSSLIDMERAFWSNDVFNQDISTKTIVRSDSSTYTAWDVSNVENIDHAFASADVFNQDISNWDVSNVSTMNYTFSNSDLFDQDIFLYWDTSNVTDMEGMFMYDTALDVENLDTSSVINMRRMFEWEELDVDISTRTIVRPDSSTYTAWDVSNVENMERMFRHARFFNQDISNWDTSSVTNMTNMFEDARVFDQDISSWSVWWVTACNEFDSDVTLATWVEAEKPNFSLSCTKGI